MYFIVAWLLCVFHIEKSARHEKKCAAEEETNNSEKLKVNHPWATLYCDRVVNVPGPYDRITLPTCVFGPDGKYSQALFRVHFNYFMSTGSFTFRNTEQTINSSFIPILRDLDWTYRVIVYLDWWWPLCKQYRKQTQIISIVAGEKACRTDTLSQIVKNLK